MNMGILTTPAGGPASLSVHGGICVYRVTLRRLHWVGEIDTSILMTLVGGPSGEGKGVFSWRCRRVYLPGQPLREVGAPAYRGGADGTVVEAGLRAVVLVKLMAAE